MLNLLLSRWGYWSEWGGRESPLSLSWLAPVSPPLPSPSSARTPTLHESVAEQANTTVSILKSNTTPQTGHNSSKHWAVPSTHLPLLTLSDDLLLHFSLPPELLLCYPLPLPPLLLLQSPPSLLFSKPPLLSTKLLTENIWSLYYGSFFFQHLQVFNILFKSSLFCGRGDRWIGY